MMTFSHKTFFRRGLAALALIVISHTADAAIITPLDQWPGEWTTVKSGSATVVALTGEKLEITRPGTGSSAGAITFWNGNSEVSDVLGDFSGSVVLSHDSRANDVWGVVVGAQSKTFTNNATTNYRGFYIGLLPNSAANGGGLYVWENPLNNSSFSATTAVEDDRRWSDALPYNTDFLLEFSVSGAKIEASLWNLDPITRQKTGEALASLTYIDDQVITGYFGLSAFRLGNPTSRYFSELKLEPVPEPGSMALGMAGLLVGYGIFRRRSR